MPAEVGKGRRGGAMDPFVLRVAQTIDRYALIPDGAGVVVGLSGGPDSTALLSALAALSEARRYRLVAAHLDHGLREGAAEDARFAVQLAARLGVPCLADRRDVRGLAQARGLSLEAAGRAARYAFLHQVADDAGCCRIAVGHHRDDQVETVLLNLLAGAGSDGLAGMRPRRGRVVRPLYEVTREEILAYLARNQLPFRTDPSNADPVFTRNRVRRELLPLLRDRFNRRVDDAVWRMARLLSDEVDYLEAQAEALLKEARLDLPGAVWLRAAVLRDAPPALRRRALRRAYWQAVAGEAEDPDEAAARVWLAARHVAAMEEVLASPGAAVDLPAGVRAEHQQGRLRLARAGRLPEVPEPQPLPVPGLVEWLPPWQAVGAEVLDAGEVRPDDLARPGHAFLDYDRLGRPAYLTVRPRRPGDRLRPLGAPGRRKLQDLLVDRKVPRALRPLLPVVAAGEEVVWVPGAAVAHQYRVRGDTRSILHLHVLATPPEVLR